MATPSTIDLYAALYRDCLSRAWTSARSHAWTFLVPVAVLWAGVALQAFVAPLPRVGPLLVAVASATLWTGYFYVLRRLSTGARVEWADATAAFTHRARDVEALVRPALVGLVVLLAVEYTGCFGVLALCATTVSPVVELLALRDADPAEAVGQGFAFLRQRPFSWALPQAVLLLGASFAWLVVSFPGALVLELWSDDLGWLSSLAAATIVGPALHLLFVFRGVLFLELERTTHAQRLFRAKQGR